MSDNNPKTSHETSKVDVPGANTGLERSSSVEIGIAEPVKTIYGSPTLAKHSLGPLSIIAVAFNTCNSWAGIAGSVQVALMQGGPVTLLYGMLISTVAYLCIAIVMGELASVYPTAGAQYHFTSVLAPALTTRLLSYLGGFLTVVTWVTINSSTAMLTSYNIITLAGFFHSDYVPKDWHIFLVYTAYGFVVLLYNIFALKRTAWMHDIGFIFTISLFIGSFVSLLARSSPKASNEFVWDTFLNYTGWGDAVCFITGLSTTCFMFGGLDASLHLAEEVKGPRRTVPKALVAAVCIGFCTAFPYTISLLYSITDVESVLSAQGLLVFQIYLQALRSEAGATTLAISGIVIVWFMLNAIYQTSSRLIWAFARDNAFAFSSFFGQVHPVLEVPVYALTLNWFIVTVCGLLLIASPTAFNAILNSSVTLAQLTYLIPAALLLYRKRSTEFLPVGRAFAPPNWLGWTANIVAVAFTSVSSVFFCFPSFLPVTASCFNYTVVVIGIAFVIAAVNWIFHGKKHFHGPRIEYMD